MDDGLGSHSAALGLIEGAEITDAKLDIALARAGRARTQSASALAFEQILSESANQAPDDGSGIVDAVNRRLDEHIRDALEVYTDGAEREAMMDLLEGQAEPVRSRARDRQIEARTNFLRRELAGVTDDWAASARALPDEAPTIAMRAAAAVHAVADNEDAPVISSERIGDLVQATERKVLSAALGSLVDESPDEIPALLADPDGPYRQVLPEDHLEEARTEAEARTRAKAAQNLFRLERAIDEGQAGSLELKQAAGWLDAGAQARLQDKLDKRAQEARAGREHVLRVAGLVADGGSLDPTVPEDRKAADVYYESVVGPGLEALDPEARISDAAGFAARMGVLPKGARRQIRGGLAATEPAVRARAANAVVNLSEAAPELSQDFDPGLRTEAYLIANLVDSGVDVARAVEMADGALARNSAADLADRERRITEENHAAENRRFLAVREDGIATWLTKGGGQPINPEALRAAFDQQTRTVFLRTGDLASSQNIALADLRREMILVKGETAVSGTTTDTSDVSGKENTDPAHDNEIELAAVARDPLTGLPLLGVRQIPLEGAVGGGVPIGAAISAGELIRWLLRSKDDKREQAPPPPPTPGFEPPEPPRDTKTEFPAGPPNVPELRGIPIPEIMKQDQIVFQALSDEIRKEMQKPLESHRGYKHTQRGHDIIIGKLLPKVLEAYGQKNEKPLKHDAGGNVKGQPGSPKKEEYIPNKTTKGKKGSSNPDLTLKDPRTKEKIRINTGVTLKDGKTPVARERRQLNQLAKNVGGDKRVGHLKKLRPGMDEKEWKREVLGQLKEIVERHLGPPPR